MLIGGDRNWQVNLVAAACLQARAGDQKTAYITGEESVEQVRMRAVRLGLHNAEAGLAAACLADAKPLSTTRFGFIGHDSIQTMFVPGLDSAPGTVSQVRASAHELIRAAKSSRAAVMLLASTKDGAIADHAC